MTVLLILPAGLVNAVPVEDLYVAEILLPGDTRNALQRGARQGLIQVLVRVSGTTAVEDSDVVSAALGNAANYYYQYSFDSTDRTIEVDGEEVPARLLRIHFEAGAVARLLHSGGFRVWGSNRPGILVWIAVNEGEGRRLISESEDSELVDSLNRQAKRRGLPVLYPLLDLEDEANLSPTAVWGFFPGRITEASRRYSPDSILTGRVMRRSDGRWSAHWSYFIGERWVRADSIAPDVDTLVEEIMDRLADDLVSRYAIDSSRGNVLIRVDAVDSLRDYAALNDYLETLQPVLDSQVVEVDGSEVLYRLNTEGQHRQLVEIIELDEKMVLMNPGAVDQSRPLHYRWLE